MHIANRILFTKRFLSPLLTFARTRKEWWYPDPEYLKQFGGVVLYPDEVTSRWKVPNWNGKSPPREWKVKNMIINFGCAHPAAHGLLRLVLELDGEVGFSRFC